MFDSFFTKLVSIDSFFWGYVAFVLIIVLGSWLTIRMGVFQIRGLPSICKTFYQFMILRSASEKGIHPLRVFFASVGGMIGIGNVVGIVTAVQIGGPGALFWVWIAGLIGAVIKYAEIFLGFKYRVPNKSGGYDGGPIHFLKAAFKSRWIPLIVAGLLCVYGVEIYQFSVITDTLSVNWNWNRYLVMGGLLLIVLYAGKGGIRRISSISSWLVPCFLVLYLSMGFWLVAQELHALPAIFCTVFKSAFGGHAALGGFVGSSAILAIQHGISRSAYSSDIGIGYDSIIQSESSTVYPEKQASLAILGVFIDNLICTFSILMVLISGLWTSNIEASQLVQSSLERYFPFMNFFMPFFIFITGYTTVIAYYCVGMKCARFLAPRHGEKLYMIYALFAFVFFSFFDQSKALLVMSISGALLLSFNLLGIFRLRHQIQLPKKEFISDKGPAEAAPDS